MEDIFLLRKEAGAAVYRGLTLHIYYLRTASKTGTVECAVSPFYKIQSGIFFIWRYAIPYIWVRLTHLMLSER